MIQDSANTFNKNSAEVFEFDHNAAKTGYSVNFFILVFPLNKNQFHKYLIV